MFKTANVIGLKELRENAGNYIAQINKGKSFIVVRRSKPVFKMMPVVDEWGDEGNWETIVDFTKIKKGGVSAERVLKHLRKLNEQARQVSSPPSA